MATNKRKTTTAIVAGVTAVALLLGGTFAWTSISQQAKNEAAGIVNVGGRLHDDFNGTNKDVYVENFTDPLDGGQPIYARVKLTEYMEVGQDAGGFGADVNGDNKVTAVPVVENTDINDPDTWSTHVPDTSCAVCATEGTCKIHEHWTWTMGGDNSTTGQTTFMPTFNKDKDSLAADINGTYHGTDNTDKVYYDDYVTYVTENGAIVDVIDGTVDGAAVTIPDGATGANALTEANKDVTTVTGTAYYDDDTDTDENDHANGTGVRTETETHTAKQTSTASVMTMQAWIDAGSQPGNFWVHDTDGWAYWANPIMPGEATGLLLDGIEMEKNPGEKCYYAINVVGQFATVNDWEYFTDSTPSDEAMELLTAASQNVATVTVTNLDGVTTVDRGATVKFGANISVNGQQVLAASDFTWSVLNADLTENTASTISAEGVLTVGADETAANLIVVAKAKDAKYLGALGMSSIALTPTEYSVVVSAETKNVDVGNTLTLSVAVTKNDETDTNGVIWSVDSTAGSTITDGVLTVSANEAHGTELTVTATSVADNRAVGTYPVTVYNGYDYLNTVAIGTTEKVRIDDTEWYVLARDEENNKALIWAVNKFSSTKFGTSGTGIKWRDSLVRSYLNGEYLASLDILKDSVIETTIYTATHYDRSQSEYVETTDQIFLLSEADLYGTANGKAIDEPKEYTLGECRTIATKEMRLSANGYWLRSPYYGSGTGNNYYVACFTDYLWGGNYINDSHGYRPAMWVSIDDEASDNGESWTDGTFTVENAAVTDGAVTLAPGESITVTYSGSVEVVNFSVDVLNADDTYASGVSHGLTYASAGENTWTVTHSCTDTCSCPDDYYYQVAVNDGEKADICALKIYISKTN